MKWLALLLFSGVLVAQGADVVWLLDGSALRGQVAFAGSNLVVSRQQQRPMTVQRAQLLALVPGDAPLALGQAVQALRDGEPGAAARFAEEALKHAADSRVEQAVRHVYARARLCLGHDAAAEVLLARVSWPQQDGPLALDALHWRRAAIQNSIGAAAASALMLRATRHESFARLDQHEALLLRSVEALCLASTGAPGEAESLLDNLIQESALAPDSASSVVLHAARARLMRPLGTPKAQQAMQRLRALACATAQGEAALLDAEEHIAKGRPELVLALFHEPTRWFAGDGRSAFLMARAAQLLGLAGDERMRVASLAHLRSIAGRCEDPFSAGAASRLLRGEL
ncbi:MAG: hypothetical protein EXS14_10860 [Planctomycetes bacterium]|nr:hypothetical protein [Planctomycetota bacterium]